MKWYCDGAGWNGKISRFCVLKSVDNPLVFSFNKCFTNNQMEYSAILKGLELCSEGDVIISDSQLAINQIKGVYCVNSPKLVNLCRLCRILVFEKNVELVWVKRNENLAGIFLEKHKGVKGIGIN